QMTEIAAMFLLAFALRRLGLFKVLLIGICSNIWRFIAFAIDDSRLIVFSGILCHGFTYAFVSLAIMIYIDSQCDRKVRAGVHQLLSIVNMGCGATLGTVSGGFIMDLVSDEAGTVNYMLYWMIPASIAILCLVVAIFFIPAELRAKIRSSSSGAPNPL
ncbi:MAG: MFS transporter, partial [Candidatus Sumerlaeota bacterium]